MNKFAKNIGVYILIFALILGFAYFLNFDGKDEVKNIPLSKMIEYLEAETNGTDKINEINIVGTEITATLADGSKVFTTFDSSAEISYLVENYVGPLSKEGAIKYSSQPKKESIVASLLPTLIMIAALIFRFGQRYMRNCGL